MADTKISDLTDATEVLDADEFVLARAGATLNANGSMFKGFDQLIVKAADETVTASTTLQNDDHLKFVIGASATEIWFFEGMLLVAGGNTAMDFKWLVNGPADATGAYGAVTGASGLICFALVGPGTSPLGLAALGAAPTSFPTNTANQGYLIAGWVFGGGTGGDVQLQWAQNTSDAGNLTVKKGSFLRARKLIV